MTIRAVAMPFNWIFSILVGGFILLIAIFGATQFVQTGEQQLNTETAAQLVTLLDPLEIGLASGKSSQLTFRKDIRTVYTCSHLDNRPFGTQTISFSEKTLGNQYNEQGGAITIKDKYVFAPRVIEGKNLYIFSKPFNLPFRIGDVVVIGSDHYCFYQAPKEIQQEIEGLNLPQITFSDTFECTGTTVCFAQGGAQCDMVVEGLCTQSDCLHRFEYGVVSQDRTETYFIGNGLYGALFSSPEIYECNMKRLFNKFSELSLIYEKKIDIIEQKSCSSTLGNRFSQLRNDFSIFSRSNAKMSKTFVSDAFSQMQDIDRENNLAGFGCSLY